MHIYKLQLYPVNLFVCEIANQAAKIFQYIVSQWASLSPMSRVIVLMSQATRSSSELCVCAVVQNASSRWSIGGGGGPSSSRWSWSSGCIRPR